MSAAPLGLHSIVEYLVEFTKITRSLDFFVEACAELDSVFSSMEKRKNEENFNSTLKYNYFEVNSNENFTARYERGLAMDSPTILF